MGCAQVAALKAMPDADSDLSDADEVLDWSRGQRGIAGVRIEPAEAGGPRNYFEEKSA